MNVEIAQRLAELRRKRGYSQESLARELGLSRQAVSKWERAESSPDTDNLIQLAKLYGVSLDELLNVDADVAADIAYERADKARSADDAQAASAAEASRLNDAIDAAVSASRAAAQAAEAAGRSAALHAGHAEVPPSSRKQRGPWRSFPYAIVMTILFFVLVFVGLAPLSWLVFLTIPIYNWMASILDGARLREDHPTPSNNPVSARGAVQHDGARIDEKMGE